MASATSTNPAPQGGTHDPAIWRPIFLDTLRRTGNVADSARAAGVNYSSCYRAKQANKEFAEAWDDALDEAVDSLEKEAWRRGRDGVDRPVIYKGEFVMDPDSGERVVLKEYSDTLLITLLKAHRPSRFVPTGRLEHTGPGGGPIKSEVKLDSAVAAAEAAFLANLPEVGTPGDDE